VDTKGYGVLRPGMVGAVIAVMAIDACSGSSGVTRRRSPDGGTSDSGPTGVGGARSNVDGGRGRGSGGVEGVLPGTGGVRFGTRDASFGTGGVSFGTGGVPVGNGGTFGAGGVRIGAGGVRFGTGGVRLGTGGGVPVSPSSVGASCIQDLDCPVGLICIRSDSNVLGGGPAGGLCTAVCVTDADCAANSICVGFNSPSGEAFCLERCAEGTTSASKCHGRLNQVCGALLDASGNPVDSACQPMCGSDSDCGGRLCDFRTGMCMDALSGTLPIGSPCDANASTDLCNGFCTNFYAGGAPQYGACFGACSLNSYGVGCGVDLLSQPPYDTSCLAPSTAASGDQGLCFQLCDCNGDCRNTAFVCRPWADQASIDATGKQGYCRGPVDDAGLTVPSLQCAAPP
jgi:hypothetical protein